VIFREDMGEFIKAFQGALDFMGKDDGTKAAVKYSPSEKPQPKRARTPSGFAGGEAGERPEGAPDARADGAAPKRRIVVRRKSDSAKKG
jgi:hypothetical protein